MPMFNLALGSKPQIVCIGAHCDDIEIGCGGTLHALAQANASAHFHCWVFSGGEVRARESRACLGSLLGPRRFTLQVFAHRDGYFPHEWSTIKERMQTLSRSIEADLVLTHAGTDLHQDHRTLSELTWNHFREHTLLEYEIVKYDGDLGRPNMFFPLTEGQLTCKLNALTGAFVSQRGKPWFTRSTFEAVARLRGVECNAPSGFAEAFYAKKALLDFAQLT